VFRELAGEIGSKHLLHRPAGVWDHLDPGGKQPSLQGPGDDAADEYVYPDADQIRGLDRRPHVLKGFLPAIHYLSRIYLNEKDRSGFIEDRRNPFGKYGDRYLHDRLLNNNHAMANSFYELY